MSKARLKNGRVLLLKVAENLLAVGRGAVGQGIRAVTDGIEWTVKKL